LGPTVPGTSLTYGFLNYTALQVSKKDFFVVRNEKKSFLETCSAVSLQKGLLRRAKRVDERRARHPLWLCWQLHQPFPGLDSSILAVPADPSGDRLLSQLDDADI